MRPTSPHARAMRQTMPDAEKRLWAKLRNRQLDGLKFRRQHTIGAFVADFACVEAMLIVEADGSQHDATREVDGRRTHYLERAGWRVLRFWNVEILTNTDGVLRMILAAATAPPQDVRS